MTLGFRARAAIVLVWVIAVSAATASARQVSRDPQAALLGRAGWQAIQADRIQEAAQYFERALALDPQSAMSLLGAGLAAHLQGQAAPAKMRLRQALQIDGTLTPASLLLGVLLYKDGDLDGAIRVYEDAVVHAPEEPQLVSRLERWRQEAALHDSFRKTMSTNFTVLFEGPAEEALAAKALEALEAAYWRVGTALFTYPPEPITVVLYTQEQFRDITRSPNWAAGLYDGKIRVPVRGALEQSDELERVLAHEFTHALVRSLAPRNVPTWLNEGLAGVFERGDLGWAETIVRDAPALIPLERLHGSFSGLSNAQAKLAYAESALATRRLIDQAGAPPVVALLQDLAADVEFGVAFNQRMLMSYADFQRTWSDQTK
jgi:tetratricopeptide (TPR) repeat protein